MRANGTTRRPPAARLALLLAALLTACAPRTAPAPDDLSEAASWLQGYLRLDTTNPPGNEGLAVDYLSEILAAAEIDVLRLDRGDGHPSLLATLPATRDEPSAGTLLLLHHTDVVPADTLWRGQPFAGELREGTLWGRGAIDSKSLGIAQLAALVALERSGVERRHAVALLAAADEERGGKRGVGHWLEARPELFANVTAVLNEGGSNRGYQGRLHWWGVETVQKRPLWLEATADSAETLIAGLRRLIDLPPSWRVSPDVQLVFTHLAPLYNQHWQPIFLDLERHMTSSGPTTQLLPGMATFFLDSLQVNTLELSTDGRARARIDVRLLPDSDADAWLRRIEMLLGPQISLELLLAAPVTPASRWGGPIVEILKRELSGQAPVVPQMAAGITDSRYFRQRGVPAYGFSPFILDAELMRTVHARDERIPAAELDRGVARMTAIVTAWATDGDQSPPASGTTR